MDTTLSRPQPLGIHPLPTGYLLLPDADADDARAALLRGEHPAELPAVWQFYGAALLGDVAGALALLDGDESACGRYNRFVLAGARADYTTLKRSLPAEWLPILDAAAYTMGIIDSSPMVRDEIGVVRAHLLLVSASAHLEAGRARAALGVLKEAADAAQESPLFRAQLLSALADARRDVFGGDVECIDLYRQALRLLAGSPLTDVQGSVWLNLGTLYQERGALIDAARAYQETLRFITRASDAEAYALAQNNLALTYLAAPMSEASEQLRASIAISALREALTVYTHASHPMQWASAQLNLANALQYLPSSHPADNLAEAVQLYEDLYAVRTPTADPLGYARLRANQGNALAHLGILDHAGAHLREAQGIFRAHGDHDAVESIEATLRQFPQKEICS
jgi:tetratricopeptide (TPR) repeat protein